MDKRRVGIGVLLLFGALRATAADPDRSAFPNLKQQLAQVKAPPGSALARFIADNQDFWMLRADEFTDRRGIPPWLRVAWRKAHPEGDYSPDDPTGGYPLALAESVEWMEAHPSLRRQPRERDVPPEQFKTLAGLNVNASGTNTVPRSETDIRVDYLNPQRIIAASNNILAAGWQAQYWSTNGGQTWGRTTLPASAGDNRHGDPTVDWTSDGTAWTTTLGINDVTSTLRLRAYRSTDGGANWMFDGTISGAQTAADKQMIWVDHAAGSPFRNNLYVCWHNNAPVFATRRTGPAGAWQAALQVSGAETTGTGVGCDVKSNANGDVFLAWPDTGSRRIFLARSTNGGATYTAPAQIATTFGSFNLGIPAMNSRRALIYTSLGAFRDATRNNVYATWADLSGDVGCTAAASEPGSNAASNCKSRIWFARSTDGGVTWTAPVRLNHQAGRNDQFHPRLTVDEQNGWLSVVYYDTVDDAGRLKTHLYYQASTDNGATWSTPFRITTAQTNETSGGANLGNQYGDYIGFSGINGLYYPSWTDRRNNAREETWTAAVNECHFGIGLNNPDQVCSPLNLTVTASPTPKSGCTLANCSYQWSYARCETGQTCTGQFFNFGSNSPSATTTAYPFTIWLDFRVTISCTETCGSGSCAATQTITRRTWGPASC